MVRAITTSSLLCLALVLVLSLQSNSAAPSNKQLESFDNPGQLPSKSIDEEVVELEHLKHQSNANGANTKEEILPQLEKQLEEEAQASASLISSDEEDGNGDDVDTPQDNDTSSEESEDDNNKDYSEKLERASESLLLKTLAEYHHKEEQKHHAHLQESHSPAADSKATNKADDNSSLMKLLPGSARLTFGQHYGSDTTITTPRTTTLANDPHELSLPEIDVNSFTSNGQRRGDNAEALLRHSGGQYSAFDMAQYVFWTGDEAGVARAVEELIQQNLMSRENAIQLLRDIRLGIDYLENTYSTRSIKPDRQKASSSTTMADTETSTLTTDKQEITNANIEQYSTIAPHILKIIERLPSLLKLNELGEQTESTQDYDDVVGRLRLADFLYAEYSLEEVIYQLAKVMFTQSLTRGSEPAQQALQKLTEFLESEGSHGRISPALQKKILDVLLAALADTLAENPELMNAARIALGKHIEKIPQKHPYSH